MLDKYRPILTVKGGLDLSVSLLMEVVSFELVTCVLSKKAASFQVFDATPFAQFLEGLFLDGLQLIVHGY